MPVAASSQLVSSVTLLKGVTRQLLLSLLHTGYNLFCVAVEVLVVWIPILVGDFRMDFTAGIKEKNPRNVSTIRAEGVILWLLFILQVDHDKVVCKLRDFLGLSKFGLQCFQVNSKHFDMSQ